ncbi:unnamed protein product [Trichobilharzia regenti]|nr:unnamed protein product [Trichobilharzia regenti]
MTCCTRGGSRGPTGLVDNVLAYETMGTGFERRWEHHHSLTGKCRCDTPYLIKIFNYRIQSTSINQPTYSKNYLFPRINHKSNEKFNNNNHNQFMNGLKSEEQITICLGSTLDIDLNRAIYMSGYIPRMNILLYRINYTNVGQYSRPITRPAYSPPSTSSSLSSLSASHLSTPQLKSPSMFNKYSFITYDIEYRFVYGEFEFELLR